jgi:hypothetical protein
LYRFCCEIARLRKESPLLLYELSARDDIGLRLGEQADEFILADGLLLVLDGEVDVGAVAPLAGLQQTSHSAIGEDDVVRVSVFLVC